MAESTSRRRGRRRTNALTPRDPPRRVSARRCAHEYDPARETDARLGFNLVNRTLGIARPRSVGIGDAIGGTTTAALRRRAAS